MQPSDSQALLIQAGPMLKNILGGVSMSTLQRWLADPALGFPRPIKIGQRRFWRQAEVTAWVQAREVAA